MKNLSCLHCGSLNSSQAKHCQSCHADLRSPSGRRDKAAHFYHSPFSYREQDISWNQVLFSSRPSGKKLRYRVLLFALFTVGITSLFQRLTPYLPQQGLGRNPSTLPIAPGSTLTTNEAHNSQLVIRKPITFPTYAPSYEGIAWDDIRKFTKPRPSLKEKAKLRPISLQFQAPVPSATLKEVRPLYEQWKQEYQKNFDEVASFMDLYAPDAKIKFISGELLPLDQLHSLMIEVRQAGFYSKVVDIPPQPNAPLLEWRSNGKQVELLAKHSYEDQSGNYVIGQRRLVWEKRGNQWKIVEDEFPQLFGSPKEN